MVNKAPRFVIRCTTLNFDTFENQHEDIAMYPTMKMATDRILVLEATRPGGTQYVVRDEVAIAAQIIYFVENGETEYVTGPYTKVQAEDMVDRLRLEGHTSVGVTKPGEYDYMACRVQTRAAFFALQAILNPVFL